MENASNDNLQRRFQMLVKGARMNCEVVEVVKQNGEVSCSSEGEGGR